MSNLDQIESIIIDELYLLISFDHLVESLDLQLEQLKSGLRSLIEAGYVDQLRYSDQVMNFERQNPPDLNDLMGYHYLATKKGMFAHNTL